ncbi:MAG: hypothetical protein COA79_04505 [Planctomycetota bacterium]|nr:MAG: hypothetical protein COA79_04505 [Planctomycetota bacterium]
MPNDVYPVTLSEHVIMESKPDDMGCLEIELQASPIRTQKWFHKNGDPMKNSEILNEWLAIRGWVCQRLEEPDHEGPDHHLIIAYQFEDQLYQQYFKPGYDSYHWVNSYPEHSSWFYRTLNPRKSLTLLINPKDHGDVIIFGQLESFVRENDKLKWCAN